MIGAAAAYMAGLFFASFFTSPVLIAVFAAVVVAAFIVGRKYGFKLCDYVMMSAFFTAALTVFSIYTSVSYDRCIAFDGCEGHFEGKVVSAVSNRGDSSSYILKGHINGDIQAKVTLYTSETNARLGDTISIGSCTFSRISKDYLFDSERYYKSDGVFLSLNNAKDMNIKAGDRKSLENIITEYRERITDDFCIKLGEDSGDLLSGMVFGEKRGMEQDVKTAVYRCGIGHILAVSGLHVSVAVIVLMGLLKMCHVNKFVAFAAMEALIIFIISLANYPVSAVRAAIMMNFFYAAGLFRRQNDTFNSLAGAVLLICLIQPYVVYDTGFILSVAGTFGIGVFAPYMTKDMPRETFLRKLTVNFAVMLCTTVCILPFSLMFFDETSLISPLTNIIIVPFCSASMVIGLVYALTGGVVDLLSLAKVINDIVLHISDAAARIRFTHFACGSKAITASLFICGVLVFFTAAIFRNKRYICTSVAAALVFLFVGSAVWRIQRNDKVIIAVLGKENNAALVVSSGGSTEVIDLNGHYRSASYVRKYLASNDINSVGTVVLAEKVNSSFSSYTDALSFTDIGTWLVFGDEDEIAVYKNDLLCIGDHADIVCGDCRISCEADTVCVSAFGKDICIADNIKSLRTDCALSVVCGNSTDDTAADDRIFINGKNNFEIVLSESGSLNIRRM